MLHAAANGNAAIVKQQSRIRAKDKTQSIRGGMQHTEGLRAEADKAGPESDSCDS